MSSEHVTPPPIEEENAPEQAATTPEVIQAPHVHFSVTRWVSGGVIRLLYRSWTRVAAHLFPEDSWG